MIRRKTIDGKITPKAYTDDYRKLCKTTWWKNGKIEMTKLPDLLPEDDYGRKPSLVILRLWRDEDDWDVWADELDLRVEMEIDDVLVAQRVRMLKEQAARGREMQVMGMEYLRQNDFDSSSSAVSAIDKGHKIERTSRGISERLEKLLTLGDEDLTKEALKLLGQAQESGEVIDMEAEDIEDDEETDS